MTNSTNTPTALPAVYLNPAPTVAGHFCVMFADGSRVDSCAGPRDFIINVYRNAGHKVVIAD